MNFGLVKQKLLLAGDYCTYGGSGCAGNYFQFSSQLPHAFRHSTQTNANGPARILRGFQHRSWNSCSLIVDLYSHVTVRFEQPYLRGRASGVPMNVRQAFLQDAEDGQLCVAMYAAHRLRHFETFLNATAVRKSILT